MSVDILATDNCSASYTYADATLYGALFSSCICSKLAIISSLFSKIVEIVRRYQALFNIIASPSCKCYQYASVSELLPGMTVSHIVVMQEIESFLFETHCVMFMHQIVFCKL